MPRSRTKARMISMLTAMARGLGVKYSVIPIEGMYQATLAALDKAADRYSTDIRSLLRDKKLQYSGVAREGTNVVVRFRDAAERAAWCRRRLCSLEGRLGLVGLPEFEERGA